MKRVKFLFIALLCCFCASATENMTAASNCLKGPVKSVKSVMVGVTSNYLEFDRQGRVIKEVNNEGKLMEYNWGDDGKLSVILKDKDGNPIGTRLSYEWAYQDNTFVVMLSDTRYVGYVDNGDGRMINKIVVSDGKTAVYNYTWDENNLVTEAIVVSPDNTAPEMSMTIRNEQIDAYGNAQRQISTVLPSGPEYTSMYKYEYYED